MPVINQPPSASGILTIRPLSAQITQNPSNSCLNLYLVFDNGSKKIQSSISHSDGTNISWNEEIQLDASKQQAIMIEVWDKNNSNDVLGVAQLQVPKVIAMGGNDQDFFPIFYNQKLAGTLQIAASYKGNDVSAPSDFQSNYPSTKTSSNYPGLQSQPIQKDGFKTPSQMKQQLYTQEPLKTTPQQMNTVQPMNPQQNYAPQQPLNQAYPVPQQAPIQQPMMMQPQYVPNTTMVYGGQPQTQVVYTQQPSIGFVNMVDPCYDPCYNPFVGSIFGGYGHHFGGHYGGHYGGHHGHHGHHC